MLFVGTSIIHPSTEGVFLLCNILDLLIYSYELAYAEQAQKNADMIHAALDYVQGSNRILEKLVSGEWDEQFLVAEPGHLIRHGDFF